MVDVIVERHELGSKSCKIHLHTFLFFTMLTDLLKMLVKLG